jgi:hypothetical protein
MPLLSPAPPLTATPVNAAAPLCSNDGVAMMMMMMMMMTTTTTVLPIPEKESTARPQATLP